MGKQQEQIQFLDLHGIFGDSFNLIFARRKIFSQITLAFICPLTLIFLAYMQISHYYFADIVHNKAELVNEENSSSQYLNISKLISSEWTTIWAFKMLYFIFFLCIYLLSTCAIVHTVACIYSAKTITFKKVICFIPKVYTRLMVTSIWCFIGVFAYNIVASLVLLPGYIPINRNTGTGFMIFALLCVIYTMGYLYISIIWHLASVISVLEQEYGIEAMIKSKALIKGKLVISQFIFLLLNLGFVAIQLGFQRYFVPGNYSLWIKLGFGIFCFFSESILTLFALIIQTVLYFVCKSYRHEIVASNLEVYDYLEDYVCLKYDQDVI